MTADCPLLFIDEFEELALAAPETVRLEFINGRIEVRPLQDGNRAESVAYLQDAVWKLLPGMHLYPGRGLKVESGRAGRAIPDGVLAPEGLFRGHGEWSDPDGVLMVVEVTTRDTDTNRRVRVEKCDGYAAADIPVYLLLDREHGTVTVHSEPKDGSYRSLTTRPYGTPVELPAPVGFTLETEQLKKFAQ
ncbi:Uma2 family endonuclease [Streptomyces triculaminicus]|uniref:Uma2 family endonuclease n=1 Tax=Streptomyces triculaminicus TaxID=2816232 RepID=UPI0033E5A3C4